MRIVQWSAQERVDQPDITAMSFLVLGEFRRLMRSTLLGESALKVLRGFAVEPAAVPNNTVIVKLDPGGGNPYSAAIGAENTGFVDHGALIGDRDSNGSASLEGNAQQIIDFTGQPNGTYTIEMRFEYASGANDNRAFWNAGTDTEFVAPTDTRFLPTWVAQRVAAPTGGEWLPLATVSWTGIAIVAGVITDVRPFAFEGTAPFRQSSQTGSGGQPDFARATARGALANERNGVYRALRSLARQVQDLKGPANDGQWDWFSYVYKPWDPSNALTAGRTKNLRSVDTVTYTIGDGVTSFGDFNGVSAVNDCFDHIAAIPNGSRAEFIDIVIHGNPTASYTWTGKKDLQCDTGQPLTVRVRNADSLDTGASPGIFGRPSILVDGAALGVNDYALIVGGSGGGNLILDGIQFLWTGTTASRGLVATSGFIDAKDCYLDMGSSIDVAALYLLSSAFAPSCRLSQCFLRGRIQMYGVQVGGRPDERNRGLIEHCRIENAQIRLHRDTATAGSSETVNGFSIRNCYISGRGTAPYNSSVAMIDALGAGRFSIEKCTLSYGRNEDCIRGERWASAGADADPFLWVVRDCQIFDGTSNGTHTVGAGANGANGTGWAIYVDRGLDITIQTCRISVTASIDAGGIRAKRTVGLNTDFLDFTGCDHETGGTDSFNGVVLDDVTQSSVNGLRFQAWGAGATRVRCVNVIFAYDISCAGWVFDGYEAGGTYLSLAANYSALRIEAFENIVFQGCTFQGWNRDDAVDRVITFEGSGNIATFSACHFHDCGRFVMIRTAGTVGNVNVDSCAMYAIGGSTTGEGFDLQGITRIRFTNNTIDVDAGAGIDALVFNTTNYLVMGNVAPNADIRRSAAVTGRGYNEGGQDLNLVNAYT